MQKKPSMRSLNASFQQSQILENDPNSSIVKRLQSKSFSQNNMNKSVCGSVILNNQLAGQKIHTLTTLIKNHHNPFLFLQLKNFFLTWNPQDITSVFSLPNYFNIELIGEQAQEFQDVYRDKGSEKDKKEMIKSFRKQLQELKYTTYLSWQAARILLTSVQIKKIPLPMSQKLMKLIKNAETEAISKFINEEIFQLKGFNSKSFLAEITKQKLQIGKSENKMQIPIKNLETLISQMVKTMPVENDSVQKLMRNLSNCEALKGQTIELRSVKSTRFVNGKIRSAQFDNKKGLLKLDIQAGSANKVVQIYINEYPNRIKVYGFVKIPLAEEIDFGNIIDKWQKLSQLNRFIYKKRQIATIEINNKFFGQASFLSNGKYNLICNINKYSQSNSYQLIFQQEQKKQKKEAYRVTVLNKSKDNQTKAIKYNGKIYSYQQFTNSYFMNKVQSYELSYSNKKEATDCLKIYESHGLDERYFYQKLKKIEEQKSNVLNMLQTEVQNFEQSDFFRDFISKNQVNEDYLKTIGVMRFIKLIVQQKRFVNEVVTLQEVITEILLDFNYATLINKQNTLDSIRKIRMFIKSEDFCEPMTDKVIIAVYGNTGSGKSTTVNYLTGVPLEERINECGDKIILINQGEFRSIAPHAKPAKIGYSNLISQTLYSQAYKIIDQKELNSQIKLKQDMLFCDNPGFEDTRGISYQICTHLSMDRAIQVCKSISKVVLIISSEMIKSQRGIHLIRLMNNIYERFPTLENHNSNTFANFSILITKSRLRGRQDINLNNYLQRSLGQLRIKRQELKQQKNHLQIQSCEYRIRIYQNLKLMVVLNRIHFVNIKDEIERRQILLQYSQNSNPISKSSYKKCMQPANLKLFADQLSICAHTWTELILVRYLEQIPTDLMRITKSILNTRQVIENLEGIAIQYILQKQKLQKQLKEKNQKLQKFQTQLQNDIRNFTNNIDRKKLVELQGDLSPIDKLKSSTERKKFHSSVIFYECNRYSQQIRELEIKIQQLSMKSQANIKKIKAWKLGHIKEEIISEVYAYGQEFRYSQEIYSSEERCSYVKKGQTLPSNHFSKVFKCGFENKLFGKIFKISRNYRLVPSKQFDPKNYLNKMYVQMGRYKAKIESQGFTVEDVRLFDSGKTLVLSVKMEFKNCKRQEELPFLKITHEIPSEEHFSDAIKNAQAENILVVKQMSQLQIDLADLKNRQNQISLESQVQQKRLEQSKSQKISSSINMVKETQSGFIDLEYYRRKKQKKIDSLVENITEIEKLLKRGQYQMGVNNESLKRQKQKLIKLKREQESTKWLKKRLAKLIEDQISKKIPQTLLKFIEITRISEQKNAEYKAEVFNVFKNRYNNSYMNGLLGKCQRDLFDY